MYDGAVKKKIVGKGSELRVRLDISIPSTRGRVVLLRREQRMMGGRRVDCGVDGTTAKNSDSFGPNIIWLASLPFRGTQLPTRTVGEWSKYFSGRICRS